MDEENRKKPDKAVNFKVHFYTWFCPKCKATEPYVQVGFSSLYELTFNWDCKVCKKKVLLYIPFEELSKRVPLVNTDFTQQDLDFLREMHIEDDIPNTDKEL